MTRACESRSAGAARQNIPWAHPAWQDVGVITLRSDSERRRRATAALQRLRPVVAEEAEHALGRAEAVGFLARLDLWFLDLHGPLEALYGDDEADELVGRLVRLALRAATERPTELRETDRRREVEPRWYQGPRTVGYVAYTDRFCGTLDALPKRLDYLSELGVTLPAPDAPAQAAAGARTTAATPSWTTAPSTPGSAPWTTWSPPPGRCTSAG